MKVYKIILQLLALFRMLGSASGLGLVAMILFQMVQGDFSGSKAVALTTLDLYTLAATSVMGLCNMAAGIFGLKGASQGGRSLVRAAVLGWAGLFLSMLDAVIVAFIFETPVDMAAVGASVISSVVFVFAASKLGAGQKEK